MMINLTDIITIGKQIANSTFQTAQTSAQYGSKLSGMPEWIILIAVIILILLMLKGKAMSIIVILIVGFMVFMLFGGLI